jgi:hypothetical protein
MFAEQQVKVWSLTELVGRTVEIIEVLDYDNQYTLIYASDINTKEMFILSHGNIQQ